MSGYSAGEHFFHTPTNTANPATVWCSAILSLWLYNPLHLGHFFIFLILYTVGRTPWTGNQPVARPLPTHRTTRTQHKLTQTSMPQAEFEPTVPVFERAKTVHALDRAATVIGGVPGLHPGNLKSALA
jgi:hypothetical protein